MLVSVQNLILNYTTSEAGGYVGLFLFGSVATTLIPLSPEVAAVAVWKAGMPVLATIIVLSIGNYAGNAINYYIGYTGGYWLLAKFFSVKQRRLHYAHHLFERYGPPVLLFSWLPIIGDPLTFVPGIVHYSFVKFSVFVFIGKIIRYVGLYAIFGWWI